MKTKENICNETGIPMETFHFWMRRGLIPKASGINRRCATWDDNVIEIVNFIRGKRKEGMGLDAIEAALPAFCRTKWRAAEDRLAFLDVNKSRAVLAKIVNDNLDGADIKLSVDEPIAYITTINGKIVTLYKVERVLKTVVDFEVISLAEYIEIETAFMRYHAEQGIVTYERGNLAWLALGRDENIKEILERARAINA